MEKVMDKSLKKVIGGKRFNTETAQLVGSYDSKLPPSQFDYYREDLYRKKTGDFFLHGEGGAMTKYAKAYGDSIGAGVKIIPLSLAEAKKWVENHLPADKYEELFEIVEDDNVGFTLLLPESIHKAMKERAELEGRTMKAVAVSALKEYLKEEK